MNDRCERIALNTNGYIVVGSEELMISVVNISLTGFLAKIEPTVLIPTVGNYFKELVSKSKRRFYRRAQTLKGVLSYEGLTYNFTTTNTSTLGMMFYVVGPVEFKKKRKGSL